MKRQQAITAVLAALPALILAACAWLQAQAKAAEAKSAYAGYGEYVTDQLHRDEALLKALQDCQEKQHPKNWEDVAAGMVVAKMAEPGAMTGVSVGPQEPQAQGVLDDVARSRGWEPGGEK